MASLAFIAWLYVDLAILYNREALPPKLRDQVQPGHENNENKDCA